MREILSGRTENGREIGEAPMIPKMSSMSSMCSRIVQQRHCDIQSSGVQKDGISINAGPIRPILSSTGGVLP